MAIAARTESLGPQPPRTAVATSDSHLPRAAEPERSPLEWWQARPHGPRTPAASVPPFVTRAKREAQATRTPRIDRDMDADAVRAREAELDRRWQSKKDRTRKERARLEQTLLAAEKRARNGTKAVRRSTPTINRVAPADEPASGGGSKPTPSLQHPEMPSDRVATTPRLSRARPSQSWPPVANGVLTACPSRIALIASPAVSCRPSRHVGSRSRSPGRIHETSRTVPFDTFNCEATCTSTRARPSSSSPTRPRRASRTCSPTASSTSSATGRRPLRSRPGATRSVPWRTSSRSRT